MVSRFTSLSFGTSIPSEKPHRGVQRRTTARRRGRSARRTRSHRAFSKPTYELASNRWDQQNRLVRFLQGTHESVYEYDGESHRVRIKELTSSVVSKDETFVWCGQRICQKRNSGGVVRTYFGNGFEEGSADYFYTRDHLRSVREVVASDGTTIASRLAYGPWGVSSEGGSGALSDFSYTGHHFDRPTGLSLAPARGYDPSLGRWLSMDPIGLAGGVNLYAYVEQQPVNAIDPTGNRTECMAGDDCGAGPYPGPDPPPPPFPGTFCQAFPQLCGGGGGGGGGGGASGGGIIPIVPLPPELAGECDNDNGRPPHRKCTLIRGLIDMTTGTATCMYQCPDGIFANEQAGSCKPTVPRRVFNH